MKEVKALGGNELVPEDKREMERDLLTQIKRLVQAECANYLSKGPFGKPHYCWMKEKSNEGICLYFSGNDGHCRYFEKAVLPLNDELEEDYHEARRPLGGKGIGEVPESIERKPAGLSSSGVALAENRRKSLLRTERIPGLDSEKPKKG